jgi:hypothetical protein
MYRQGDILLVPVRGERLPTHAIPVPRDTDGRLVLALGEAAGHAHAVAAADADLLADPESVDQRFLRIVTEALLTHEEHAPIALPARLYRVVRQREYVATGWREVDD